MLLLLVSFSISLSFFFLVQTWKQVVESAEKIKLAKPALAISECRLEAINLEIHKLSWIPVLIRVYLVGMFETFYIALCKRDFSKGSSAFSTATKHINEMIQSYTASSELAVVTGGDSGIGYEICKSLLEAGFRVIIGARSMEASQQAVLDLQKASGSDKISCILLDLASFESVNNFVDQVKRIAPNKDIQLLINNAGVMNIPCQVTKDGFEVQCQTNYLSPILLTCSLLPWMKKKTSRVLFASSSTLYAINNLTTDFPLKQYGTNGLDHYAYSKSCVSQLVAYLAKTSPINVYAYHPGTVRTKLFAHTTIFNIPFLSKLFDFIMLTPEEGSRTPLYLCLAKDVGPSGSFWANERVQTVPSVCINGKKDDIETLWKDTMNKCGLKTMK